MYRDSTHEPFVVIKYKYTIPHSTNESPMYTNTYLLLNMKPILNHATDNGDVLEN